MVRFVCILLARSEIDPVVTALEFYCLFRIRNNPVHSFALCFRGTWLIILRPNIGYIRHPPAPIHLLIFTLPRLIFVSVSVSSIVLNSMFHYLFHYLFHLFLFQLATTLFQQLILILFPNWFQLLFHFLFLFWCHPVCDMSYSIFKLHI